MSIKARLREFVNLDRLWESPIGKSNPARKTSLKHPPACMRRERSATKGREVYISTSRPLLSAGRDSIRPERILGISRTLPTEQGVRGCKAVNLSALIETTANEENCRQRTERGEQGRGGRMGSRPDGATTRERSSLISPLLLSPSLHFLFAFIFPFSRLSSHSAFRTTCIFLRSATSSSRFHAAAERVTFS